MPAQFRRWSCVVLAVLGVAFVAFDALLVRPNVLAIARTGRRAAGTVLAKAGTVKTVRAVRGHGERR